MSYSETHDQHLRIAVLRLLAEEGDYAANDSVIRDALVHLAFDVSRDKLRTELNWLEEQGLVTIRDVEELVVATITPRGVDVAKGRATVPGVKRPGPRERR